MIEADQGMLILGEEEEEWIEERLGLERVGRRRTVVYSKKLGHFVRTVLGQTKTA